MDLQHANGPFLTNNKLSDSTDRLSVISRVYIWSLIFEPLLYFVYASAGQTTGIPLSVSRILQIIVLISFILRLMLIRRPITQQQFFSIHLNKYFVYYFLILFASSFLGIFIFHSYEVSIKSSIFNGEADVPFLKSKYMRPFFDIFLLSYYYFYFIILSRYFINSGKALNYYFKYFIYSFYLIIFLGFADLSYSFLMGSALIKRHLGESTDVGTRFHSFLGEPRDAFVYLVYAGLILVIYHVLYSKIRYISILLYLILAAAILTQSASGILGILIGGILAITYFLAKGNKKVFYFLSFFAVLMIFVIILIPYSPRMELYIEGFSSLYYDLKSGNELPYILLVQSVNFLPFWGMFNHLMNYNYFQLLFGSGFSSSAYYNMNYIGDYSYSNPNAQITRILFDGGIVGFITYLLFLIKPALRFLKTLFGKIGNNGTFLYFLFTGSGLAHRSLIPFIFIGLVLAYNRVYRSKKVNSI